MEGEDVAIIGIGCRVPGADNINEFWRVLVNGENHIVDIPPERWNNDHFYNEHGEPGTTFVKKAGLLKGHDEWDYEFFKVSKSEAETIDPQQRLVLECAHMAFEDGGITRDQLNGTRTGVFIGAMNDDYKGLSYNDHVEETNYSATGMSSTYISSRVSHVYNLHGPCMTVDTACSSSMIAVHLGCQSIRAGESTMAVCGGVNIMLSPDQFIVLCKAGMLSPTGQCQTFCDTADGYVRGEGCGIVILKSYKQAVQDENKIWGLIKTGTNQDGRTALSMAAPSSDQQLELLKTMYKHYNADPTSLQYIEAHGTGTPVGDPVETTALGNFINSYRKNWDQNDELTDSLETQTAPDKIRQLPKSSDASNYVPSIRIGSVKTNIGHLESASGVVSLIKILLMMEHGQFVPSLHIQKDMSNINRDIKLDECGLTISVDISDWPANAYGERHGCLNCFGFGGSNTHAIVTSRSKLRKAIENEDDSQIKVISLSAMNKVSLLAMIQNLDKSLETELFELRDISFTSVYKRDHLPYRVLLFGESAHDIRKQISTKQLEVEQLETPGRSHVIFFFGGVGTAWTGMGKKMMTECAKFIDTVNMLDSLLKPLTGWSVSAMLMKDTDYDDPLINHIAIFCVQIALFETWKSLGVFPDVIVGQSVGEVAASFASGALSLEEAVSVVYNRSVALAKCTGGSMLVVGNVRMEEVENVCRRYDDDVNIAVYNSTTSCTLSGPQDLLNKVKTDFTEMTRNGCEVFLKTLKVNCAYHSKYTESSLDEFTKEVGTLKHKSSTTTQISTVTGEEVTGSDVQTSAYWVDNIRKPVKLMQAVQASIKENQENVFLEIGPKQVLKAHLKNIIPGKKAVSLASMNEGDEVTCLYRSFSHLHSAGVNTDLTHIVSKGNIVPIPRYFFNKTQLLHVPSKRALCLRGFESSKDTHMYVRQSVRSRFHLLIDANKTPFVFEHFIFGRPLVPGAYYVDAAFEIGICTSHLNPYEMSVSVEFLKSVMPEAERHQVMDVVESIEGSVVGSRQWLVRHEESHVCKITIKPCTKSNDIRRDIAQIQSRCTTHRTKGKSYECLKSMNFTYGENLQLMSQTWSSNNECLTEFDLPDAILDERKLTNIHPSVVDGLFQMFGVLNSGSAGQTYLPLQIDSVRLNRPLQKHMFGYAKIVRTSTNGKYFNACLLTPSGDTIVEIMNFFIKHMSDVQETNQPTAYQLIWNEGSFATVAKDSYEQGKDSKRVLVIGYKTFMDNYTSLTGVKADFHQINDEVISLERYDVVLLIAIGLEGVNNLKVYEDCKNIFMATKALIERAQKNIFEGAIIIVTENVVTVPSVSTTLSNLSGAVLWGMVRSALHEYPNLDLRLVDVTTKPEDLAVLHNLTYCDRSDSVEIMIRDGKMFYSEMGNVDIQSNPNIFQTSFSQCDDVVLKSESAGLLDNPYFSLKSSDQTVHEKDAYCTLHLHSFCLHDLLLYPVTLEDNDDDEYIDRNCKERIGHSIMCVEGTGQLIGGQESFLGFCVPTEASNPVSVPASCTYDINQITYFPGIMTIGVLLYHIVRICNQHPCSVVVIDEKGTSKVFVEYMFSECKRVSVLDKNLVEESGVNKGEIIVLLTKLSRKQTKTLIEKTPGVSCIVSYEQLLPRDNRIWLERTAPLLTQNLLNTEAVFKETSLIEVVPIVFQQLKEIDIETKSLILNYTTYVKPNCGDFFHHPYAVQSLHDQTVPIHLKVSEHDLFRQKCCYVTVGGLSGLGWELLRYMAEMGAGYIATIQRRNPSTDQKQKIIDLQSKYRCKIIPCRTDITNLDKLKETFKEIDATLGDTVKVKGVLHGGGVLDDCLLTNMTEENVEKVLNPKVLGTMNLHEATKHMDLDFFIMHSSVVSVTGNPGQCNYAAGNAFMDAFAYYRRSCGVCAQSINWSALSVGMAAENSKAEKLKEKGFSFLSVEEIRRCFMLAIMTNRTQIVYGKFDWTKLKNTSFTTRNPRKYVTLTGGGNTSRTKKNSSILDIAAFRKSDIATRVEMVQELVRATIANVFVCPGIEITEKLVFGSLGIDSMVSLSFVNYIRQATKLQIPISMLYSDTTTVGSVDTFILERLSDASYSSNHGASIGEQTQQLSKYLEGEVPFTQVSLLNDFQKDPFTKNIMRQVDFQIVEEHRTLNMKDWAIVFKHLLKIEPDLRRKFQVDECPYSSCLLDDVEMPLEEVPFDSLDHAIATDERQSIRMDITKVIPICAKVAISGGKTRFRLFLHGLLGDLPALTLIFQQLSKVARAYAEEQPLPEPKAKTISPVTAFRRALIPRARTLQTFWNEMFKKDIEPFTLGENLNSNFDEADWTEISVSVQKEMAKLIIEAKNISIFNFIASAYMACLHKETNRNYIPLVTYVDMRGHVRDLHDSIISCSNGVPILGDFRNLESVAKYLESSADLLNSMTQNSAYPYDLIMNEMQSEELKREIGRHRIIMEDLTHINQITNFDRSVLNYKMFFKRHVYETSLHVLYDKQTYDISLEFGYNSSVVSHDVAKRITFDLIHVMDAFKQIPNAKVRDILRDMDSSSHFQTSSCGVKLLAEGT